MVKCDVLGIGHAIVDILAYKEEAFIKEKGLPLGAMQLMEADPLDDLYQEMGPTNECSGGSAANTLAGIAGLGGTAGFIGKVGEDEFGEVFTHDLRSIGVQFATEPTKSGTPTGRCLVMVTREGDDMSKTDNVERTMATYLGASREIKASDMDQALIESASVLYIEGYIWDDPEVIKAIQQAIKISKAAGNKIAFTLSDPFCVGRHKASFLELLKDVDILFANDAEAAALFDEDNFRKLLPKLQGVCEVVAVTRGAAGSVVITKDEIIEVDAEKVDNVFDVTGAGDLYASGFLYGYTQGLSHAESAKLANRCAAEIIQHLGPRALKPLKALVA